MTVLMHCLQFGRNHLKLMYLICTMSICFAMFLWFTTYCEDNNKYLDGFRIIIVFLIIIWSALTVSYDLTPAKRQALSMKRLAIPFVFVYICVRTILNIIIICCVVCILRILIKSQTSGDIVFDKLFSVDSWWIYPMLLFLIENTCHLVTGGKRIGERAGWFEKLAVFLSPKFQSKDSFIT